MPTTKKVPKARTERSEKMDRVRGQLLAVVDAIWDRKPGYTSPPFSVVVHALVDAFPSIAMGEVNLSKKTSAFEAKWMERIQRDKHDHAIDMRFLNERARRPTDDPKFVRSMLLDALDVIGVARPRSFNWVKGLPHGPDPRVSVLTDFVIERCAWGGDLVVLKRDLFAAYLAWLAAAKKGNPQKYLAEPFTMKAFAAEMNKSLGTKDGRANEKGQARERTWQGIGLVAAGTEPAGTKSARVSAQFIEDLRHAFPAPVAE